MQVDLYNGCKTVVVVVVHLEESKINRTFAQQLTMSLILISKVLRYDTCY